MKTYTEAAKRFYRSKQWRDIRALYMQSVNGLCERCLQSGKYVPGVIVHHRVYLDDAKLCVPEYALAFENLELLCIDCHNKEHFETNKRVAFDANGDVIC